MAYIRFRGSDPERDRDLLGVALLLQDFDLERDLERDPERDLERGLLPEVGVALLLRGFDLERDCSKIVRSYSFRGFFQSNFPVYQSLIILCTGYC